MGRRKRWGCKAQRRETGQGRGAGWLGFRGRFFILPENRVSRPSEPGAIALVPGDESDALMGTTVAILMNPERGPCGLKIDSDQSAVIVLSSPKAVR